MYTSSQAGGRQLSSQDSEITLHIKRVDCADCVATIERAVGQLDGVSSCELNFTTEKLRVVGDIQQEVIAARVEELGYEVSYSLSGEETLAETSAPPTFLKYLWERQETRLGLFGALLILPGMILSELLGLRHPLIDLTSIAALATAGLPVARSAWKAIKINRQININVLMTIAGLGAVIIGAYTEAGMIMVLFAIGEALESYTADKARHSIRSMMQVVPTKATVLHTQGKRNREEQVEVEQLKVGDLILVKPGERIPMDGLVFAGASYVNQAPITGESRLIEKVPGSDVFASSINGEGSLEIEVTHLATDNTISRLVKMVEEAQERRAPAQRSIDQLARIYTPSVIILAGLIAIVPWLFFGQPLLNPDANTHGWLYRALALLVVSCPCALVLSTPVSIISAISNAAHYGVLFKGGAYLEALSKIKAFAFDKTGTLTQGQPSVIAVRSSGCTNLNASQPNKQPADDLHSADILVYCKNCNDMLALANAVEQRSEHPLARAVVDESSRRGVQYKYPPAEMVRAMTGKGVKGEVTGRQIMLGSHRYFDANIPHQQEHCAQANHYAKLGYTPIFVGLDDKYLGTITVADAVRASSREALEMLKQAGINTFVLLTGDDAKTAQVVGEHVGVTDIRAELLPEDKVSMVNALKKQYGKVAMVGDGINDAPALANADVGIAIGGAVSGTAQATETADVTLMSDDLRQLPFAYKLSRKTMSTIHTNIALSLGIKFAFLILILFGLGSMWMAVLADVGTSLLVILNGMRLLRQPRSVVG